jgi:membrane protein DedA with SNARE-associated domain
MQFLPYLGLLILSAIEGDVVYSSAVVMAHLGRLNPIAVFLSGSIGAWCGDQFYFYAARGRLTRWLDKFPKISNRRRAVEARMRYHATKLILAVRFLPGLRIAIPLACAYSGVSSIRFSALSYISALAWAGALMLFILWLGPKSLATFGLKVWWAPVIPAVIVILFFKWLSRTETGETSSKDRD